MKRVTSLRCVVPSLGPKGACKKMFTVTQVIVQHRIEKNSAKKVWWSETDRNKIIKRKIADMIHRDLAPTVHSKLEVASMEANNVRNAKWVYAFPITWGGIKSRDTQLSNRTLGGRLHRGLCQCESDPGSLDGRYEPCTPGTPGDPPNGNPTAKEPTNEPTLPEDTQKRGIGLVKCPRKEHHRPKTTTHLFIPQIRYGIRHPGGKSSNSWSGGKTNGSGLQPSSVESRPRQSSEVRLMW